MTPEAFRRNLPAAFVAGLLAIPLWMAMDREPPYVRLSGEVVPSNPAPGDFISIKWNIEVKRICRPDVPRNITRQIITATGHIIDYEPVDGVFGTEAGREKHPTTELIRTFQLPPAITPGPATYYSKACFACNPIQTFWPVCVDTPKLAFEIRAK